MTHLRERWEGVSLSGNYTLEKWLGGDDNAAFFQTSVAPDGRPAVVKLVPEPAAGGAGPLGLWRRTRQLRHPNLVELLDCGQADLDGEIASYALFEAPDDTLASALGREPLNQEESREVLDSVIDALRYLHAQGLVVGALDPGHIVAIGDRIKISTGALREAETSSACREDVRLLGELWQQALMAASPKSAEIAVHTADPNAEARWTLAEISSALAEGHREDAIPPLPPPAPPIDVPSSPPAPGLRLAGCRSPDLCTRRGGARCRAGPAGSPSAHSRTCSLVRLPEMDLRRRRLRSAPQPWFPLAAPAGRRDAIRGGFSLASREDPGARAPASGCAAQARDPERAQVIPARWPGVMASHCIHLPDSGSSRQESATTE